MLRADSVAHRDVEGDYHLPVFHHVPEGIRKSRNIRGGYARGWGLEFGDLRAKIAAAPLFHEAMGLAAGRTTLSEEDGMGIYQLLKFFVDRLPMGHNVE